MGKFNAVKLYNLSFKLTENSINDLTLPKLLTVNSIINGYQNV